jgi:mRNA interferase MazF
MVILQGEVFWIDQDDPIGADPTYRHPFVIIQNNAVNATRIDTVLVVMLTSNLRWATVPGNVLLERGEANLSKQSLVNVSQIFTVPKKDLGQRIGRLTSGRVRQILNGVRLLTEPREAE